MSLYKIFVTLGGIGLTGLIWWFFFGKKASKAVATGGQRMNISVDGGYKPEIIKIKKGINIKLIFTRHDPNTCLEEVILPDFKIKRYLPMEKPVEIAMKPEKAGTFEFHCGMGMFHGKVIVE